MRLTHFGHACVLVETDSARVLIDPGTCPRAIPGLTDLDAVLITHQHGDHLDLDQLPLLLSANPGAVLYVDTDSAPLVIERGLTPEVVVPGESLRIGGSAVEVLGGIHEPVFGDIPGCTNAAYLFDDGALFHPGDSFTRPGRDIDVLALPTSGPWLRLSDAIEYVQAIAPRIAVPVHERALASTATHYGLLSELVPSVTTFTPLTPGESTAL